MSVRAKLTGFLSFANNSKVRIGIAIVLILSAGTEVFIDVVKLFQGDGYVPSASHGVFLLGIMQLFSELADLAEDAGIAAEGMVEAEEEEEEEARETTSRDV